MKCSINDIENIDDYAIKHISMHQCHRDDPFRDWDMHWIKYRSMRHKLYRFIEKNINRPVEKVYHEVIEKAKTDPDWINTLGYFDIRNAFRDHFDNYGDFELHNGIIRKKKNRRIHKPSIVIAPADFSYAKWNGKWDKYYPKLKDIFRECYGNEIFNGIIDCKRIPIERYQALKSDPRRYTLFSRFQNERYCSDPKDRYNRYARVLTIEDLFDLYGTPEVKITKGEDGYRKLRGEMKDEKNKNLRELKVEKETKAINLLRDIESKRKALIEKDNIVTRDRLGFNKDSFVGDPYHGQKRKKKAF